MMLYCPRCKREYEEGTQRFCVQDGGRLISKTAAARKAASGGIFTSLVEKAQASNETDEILSLPNFVPVAKSTGPPAGQIEEPPAPSFIRKKEPELPVESFSAEKPAGKQVTMDELPSFQAALGDRKRNPTGRLALSWENPNVLLGHVVRGRYFIERRLNLDDICITYLAQDRAANGKRVIFKVLALGSDFIQNSAEERVALSHLHHPHIVKILDSGEMPEGMPFAVFEYVEGDSLREVLDSGDPLAASDTARIAKQVSEALSGAQQNGVLHYDVRPQKIILKPEADGSKIAKVTDFALAKGYKAPSVRKLKDVAYQSPEQLQGRELSPASESYSLAAIAYEMLTGRLPYNFTSMRELLDAQRGGLRSKPTMILPELPGQVDEIFTRALAFQPEKRYQKARDFGEAIYNALGNFAMSDEILVIDDTALAHDHAAHDLAVPPGKTYGKVEAGNDVLDLSNPVSEVKETAPVHAAPAPAWEKRAAENERMSGWAIATTCLIVLLLIAGGIFAYLNYFTGEQQPVVETTTDVTSNGQAPADTNQAAPPVSADADSVPPPREITPPANSVAFQNSKDDLPAALKKNFRGFSVYYPSSWVKNKSDKNFLDISRSTENGTPIEQILVSWYESKGTFTEDSANFPKLAKALNDKWSESIPNFQAVSQGEDFVNGRKVFQVKFQGEGETNTGEKITIWGRTLFMPPGRYGQKNGFVITMLVTSHSPEVLSVDDVGAKGELKEILYSFEPAPLDPAV